MSNQEEKTQKAVNEPLVELREEILKLMGIPIEWVGKVDPKNEKTCGQLFADALRPGPGH